MATAKTVKKAPAMRVTVHTSRTAGKVVQWKVSVFRSTAKRPISHTTCTTAKAARVDIQSGVKALVGLGYGVTVFEYDGKLLAKKTEYDNAGKIIGRETFCTTPTAKQLPKLDKPAAKAKAKAKAKSGTKAKATTVAATTAAAPKKPRAKAKAKTAAPKATAAATTTATATTTKKRRKPTVSSVKGEHFALKRESGKIVERVGPFKTVEEAKEQVKRWRSAKKAARTRKAAAASGKASTSTGKKSGSKSTGSKSVAGKKSGSKSAPKTSGKKSGTKAKTSGKRTSSAAAK